METLETIKEILDENLGIDPEEVTEDSTFDDLGIDSLDIVELISELEERLEIDFGEPDDINDIGELIDYIDTL